jgi:hypothetical protein
MQLKISFRLCFLLVSALLILSAFRCGKEKAIDEFPYKARLETTGICFNYTFTLIEGDIDPSLVEASWTNPQTNKTYINAFGIANPCNLPSNLKEGDEFYFSLSSHRTNSCAVCEAYYPSPGKKLYITVK